MRVIATAIALTLALGGTALAQEGDAAKGAKAFKSCAGCHTAEKGGKNKIGPNLFGLVDNKAGANETYKYSKAFTAKAAEGLMWTEENLDAWLTDTRKFIPKTKMRIKVKKASKRADIIAYLKTMKD